jgi:exonuclease VII small subunit
VPNLDLIATQQERLMLQTFNAIVRDIKNQAVLNEIVRALEVGNVDAVIELLGLDESTWEPMGEAIRSAYREGGITGAVQIGTIPTDTGTLVARFNVRNIRAEQWISQQSSRLITELVDDQREMVRQQLQAGLARGDNPRTTALDLVGRIDPATKKREGGTVGLTTQQAGWANSARAELENLNADYFDRKLRDKRLDAKIRRAIESGEPLDQKTIDAAILRIQQRTLKYRGDTIARTESINALRAGQFESIAQAVEKGKLNIDEVIKKWDASGDERTRPWHGIAERTYSEGLPLRQPFIVSGESMMYPGDVSLGATGKNTINCRCRLVAEIDFGKKLARVEGFR